MKGLTADSIHLQTNLNNDIVIDLIPLYRIHAFSVNAFTEEIDSLRQSITNRNLILCTDINLDLFKPSILCTVIVLQWIVGVWLR